MYKVCEYLLEILSHPCIHVQSHAINNRSTNNYVKQIKFCLIMTFSTFGVTVDMCTLIVLKLHVLTTYSLDGKFSGLQLTL